MSTETPRRSISLEIRVWAKRQGKYIHIHIAGPHRLHKTVTNRVGSRRYHPTLFHDLRRILVEHDLWSYGNEEEEPGRDN